jgi:malonyl-CoA/methylmalonyl-CoA synthetase
MRLFISGSAPLLIETFNDWRERTGHTILERYGMSETGDADLQPLRAGERRAAAARWACRCPAWACACATTRAAGARRRDRRHRGQGPQRLQGLLAHAGEDGRRVHHRPVVQDRRRRQVDADGYVTIVGRSKDLIISGGYNVYPAEIEGVSTTCRRGRERR